MHNFFNAHPDEFFLRNAAYFSTTGIAAPQVQIFKYSCRQLNLMDKLNPMQNRFYVIPTGAAVRTPQQPAVFDRKAGLQLIFKRNTAVAFQPMITAVPVLPAVLITFKNGPAAISFQQFRWNFLTAGFEKKQKIFNRNGVISPLPGWHEVSLNGSSNRPWCVPPRKGRPPRTLTMIFEIPAIRLITPNDVRLENIRIHIKDKTCLDF